MTARAKRLATGLLRRAGYQLTGIPQSDWPYDFDERKRSTILKARPYTMTSAARLAALIDAVRHVVARQIPGAIVECGVWKGGSMMAAALELMALGDTDRDLYLYDTFCGMTEPTKEDLDHGGQSAKERLQKESREDDQSTWCVADSAGVRRVLASTHYPSERVRLIEGDVVQSIPGQVPPQIAILRLDTDWYASTLHELVNLFPLVCASGIVIIDDYGYWEGARRAVDEYLGRVTPRPFLSRIDETGRLFVKPNQCHIAGVQR